MNLPILKPVELVKIVRKLGFVKRKKSIGGHLRFVHPDGRRITIPMHKGKDISRGLLRKILKDVEISAEDLERLK